MYFLLYHFSFSFVSICYLQMSDLLGKETALSNTLWALKDAAQKTFFDILKTRGEKLLRYPPLVAVDLSPPPALKEGISVLLEIIETHDSMMVPSSDTFEPVISALLDPIIQVCCFLSTCTMFGSRKLLVERKNMRKIISPCLVNRENEKEKKI